MDQEQVQQQTVSEGQEEQATAVGLEEIAAKDLPEMTVRQLQELARAEGVPADGNKAELVKRLAAHKQGRSDRHMHGQTICQIAGCGERMRVMHTERQDMGDGRVLITRQMRCMGRRRHTYPLTEIVSAGKK